MVMKATLVCFLIFAAVAAQDCTVGNTRISVYGSLFPNIASQFETTPQLWPATGVCQENNGTQCCTEMLLSSISEEAGLAKARIDRDVDATKAALKQANDLFNQNFFSAYDGVIDQVQDKKIRKALENFLSNFVGLMQWLTSDTVIPSRMSKCYYAMLTHRIGAMCMVCDSGFTAYVTDVSNNVVFEFAQSTCDYVAPRCAPFFQVYLEFLRQAFVLFEEFFNDLGQPNTLGSSVSSILNGFPCAGSEQDCVDTVCKVLLVGLANEFTTQADGLVGPALGLWGTSKRSLPEATHPIVEATFEAVRQVGIAHDKAHRAMSEAKRSVESSTNEFSTSGYETTVVGQASSQFPGDPEVKGSSTFSSSATVVFMLLVQIICAAMLF
mmetsp:Transcript_28135/g.31259  ORF Transcript_28135/g.31259 Transcript_28135/m.31259 type:complete len:382 (+) Transcript_28135:58-1203(+)